MSAWQVLGIDPTSDKKTIKRAYVKRLKVVNPEEDQDGFMALREAYEQALDQAEYLVDELSSEEDAWEANSWADNDVDASSVDDPLAQQSSHTTFSNSEISETPQLRSLWDYQTDPDVHWQTDLNQREQAEDALVEEKPVEEEPVEIVLNDQEYFENTPVEVLEEQLLEDLEAQDVVFRHDEAAESEQDVWQDAVLHPQQIHETVMALNKACNTLIEKGNPLSLSAFQTLLSRPEFQHPGIKRQVGSHLMVLLNQILEKDKAKGLPSISPDILIYLNRFFGWNREVSIDWDVHQNIVDKLGVMAETAEQRTEPLQRPFWKRALYTLFYPVGRSMRREVLAGIVFWITFLAVQVFWDVIRDISFAPEMFAGSVILGFYSFICMAIKRLTDAGEPYWILLAIFFPYVGILMFLLFMLAVGPKEKSDRPNPRGSFADYVNAFKVLYSGEEAPEANPLEGSPV